jgi:hypothetical protein
MTNLTIIGYSRTVLTNLSIERSRIKHQSDICLIRSKPNPRVEHQILFETQPNGHTKHDFMQYLLVDNSICKSEMSNRTKPLRKHINERRILQENIRDYLSRVETVKDSIVLSLLHRARNALKDVEKQNTSIFLLMLLELHHKLEFIQT